MNKRWTLAALAALAVFAVGIWLGLRSTSSTLGQPQAPAGGRCDASAKPANLNFTLKDMSGKDVRLADYKGKVILLNFWATWCPPCRMEIPAFVGLQKRYGGQGLVVLGVSVDDPMDKLPPFAREFNVNYPLLVGLDRQDIQDAYGPIFGIPVSVLISRDGKICGRHAGVRSSSRDGIERQYEEEIKALM
jgi:thiol-disulfide isomerase/thioredoxin